MGVVAVEVVLELLSCKCKSVCKTPDCECLPNGLKFTDACYLKDCFNMRIEEDIQQKQEISDVEA